MFFDSKRAKQRLYHWYESLVEALNTNVPAAMSNDIINDHHDNYLKRINKPAIESTGFIQDVLGWPTPHLGSFLFKYSALLFGLITATPWFLLFFILINIESAIKVALWTILALPIMLTIIFLCDVRFEPRTEA